MITTARCGRPMRPKRIAGLADEAFPRCGRPAGHPGHCLSDRAWRRMLDGSMRREKQRGERNRDWRSERKRRHGKLT